MCLRCYSEFQHFYSLFSKNTDLQTPVHQKQRKTSEKVELSMQRNAVGMVIRPFIRVL